MKKNILLIEDESKASSEITEILGKTFNIKEAKTLKEAIGYIKAEEFQLIIFDHDIKTGGGLDGYKKIRSVKPHANVLMVSSLGDISLAVAATKLGVNDFLRKPLEQTKFINSVETISSREQMFSLNLNHIENSEWLRGISEEMKIFFSNLEKAVSSYNDIVLFGEPGIDKYSATNLAHNAGSLKNRKIIPINLLSFNEKTAEAHFWTTIQEILGDKLGKTDEKNLCGTVLLNGIEKLDEFFAISILEFLKKRKNSSDFERIDKAMKVVLSFEDPEKLADLEAKGFLKNFSKLYLPPLRRRREDMAIIADELIVKYSAKYDKKIEAISTNLLKFFMVYDWPGNYREFELVVSASVLKAASEIITIKDVPINIDMVQRENLIEAKMNKGVSLEGLRKRFKQAFSQFVG